MEWFVFYTLKQFIRWEEFKGEKVGQVVWKILPSSFLIVKQVSWIAYFYALNNSIRVNLDNLDDLLGANSE